MPKKLVVRRSDYGEWAYDEYAKEIERVKESGQYQWFAQYKHECRFWKVKDDYMHYIMFHPKNDLVNYGEVRS